MNIDEKTMEVYIKEYLVESHIPLETVGAKLLMECIEFWTDTDLDTLLEVAKGNEEKESTNLYVDLAIFNDASVYGVMTRMWSAIPHYRSLPLKISTLNSFVINGVLKAQRSYMKKTLQPQKMKILQFPIQTSGKVEKQKRY